jgi:hypothetical protein
MAGAGKAGMQGCCAQTMGIAGCKLPCAQRNSEDLGTELGRTVGTGKAPGSYLA